MSDAAAFKATYSDFKLIRSRKVIQVVLEVPLELSSAVLTALNGMPNPAAETWVAVARLNPEKAELIPEVAARPNKLAQLIGIRCNEPMFYSYICEKHAPWFTGNDALGLGPKDACAAFVRDYCKVQSRADIQSNPEAALRWDLLESSFVCWRDQPELADA